MKEKIMNKEDYSLGEKMGSMQADISYIKNNLDNFIHKSEEKYLTKEEFKPYKIVLGFIAISILGFIINDTLQYYTKTRNKVISEATKEST